MTRRVAHRKIFYQELQKPRSVWQRNKRGLTSQCSTSPSSHCHPNVPSSTRLRTCGSSCATTGSRTASSNHTTISSTIVARPGTSSSISLGASCPSDCANGRTSSDQWDSVLVAPGALAPEAFGNHHRREVVHAKEEN